MTTRDKNNPFDQVGSIIYKRGLGASNTVLLTGLCKKIMGYALGIFTLTLIAIIFKLCKESSKWYVVINLGHLGPILMPLFDDVIAPLPYAIFSGVTLVTSAYSLIKVLDKCDFEAVIVTAVILTLNLFILKYLGQFDEQVKAKYSQLFNSCKAAPPRGARPKTTQPTSMSSWNPLAYSKK